MYEKPDHYSKMALEEGYYARSVYKLKEIQKKLSLMQKGHRVLDLRCAPGSWSQYALEEVGPEGLVVGIDYKIVKVEAPNAVIVKGNFLRDHNQERLKEYAPYDGVISDMAPDTKGDRLTDCYGSSDLVRTALHFSYDFLKKGGFFVAKIFQGGDENEIMDEMKEAFQKTKWLKPQACRKKSFEIFMIGMNFKGRPEKKEETDVFDLDNYTGEMPW